MGVLKYRSQYPVIHQSPGFGVLIRNISNRDWLTVAGLTAVSFPIGFWIGSGYGKGIRTPMVCLTVVAGAGAGFTAAILRTAGYLMGLQPNQPLAARHKYRLDFTDYQVRTEPFRTVIEEELQEIQDNPRY